MYFGPPSTIWSLRKKILREKKSKKVRITGTPPASTTGKCRNGPDYNICQKKVYKFWETHPAVALEKRIRSERNISLRRAFSENGLTFPLTPSSFPAIGNRKSPKIHSKYLFMYFLFEASRYPVDVTLDLKGESPPLSMIVWKETLPVVFY